MNAVKIVVLSFLLTTTLPSYACENFWSSLWNNTWSAFESPFIFLNSKKGRKIARNRVKPCGAKYRDAILKQINTQGNQFSAGLAVNKDLIIANGNHLKKVENQIQQNHQALMQRSSEIIQQNEEILNAQDKTQEMIVKLSEKVDQGFQQVNSGITGLEAGQNEIKGKLNEINAKIDNLTLLSFLDGAEEALKLGSDNFISYINQNLKRFEDDPLYHELILSASGDIVDQNYYIMLADLKDSTDPQGLKAKQAEVLALGEAYLGLLDQLKGPYAETFNFKQLKLQQDKSLELAHQIQKSNEVGYFSESLPKDEAKIAQLLESDLSELKSIIDMDKKFSKLGKKSPELKNYLNQVADASIESYQADHVHQEASILAQLDESKLSPEIKNHYRDFLDAKKVQLISAAEKDIASHLANIAGADAKIQNLSEQAVCEEIVKKSVLSHKPELMDKLIQLSYLKLAWAALQMNEGIDQALALESKIDQMLMLAVDDKTLLQERQKAFHKAKYFGGDSESVFLAEALPIIKDFQNKYIKDDSKSVYKIDKLDTHLYRLVSKIDKSLPIERNVLAVVDQYLKDQKQKTSNALMDGKRELADKILNDAIEAEIKSIDTQVAQLNQKIFDELQFTGCFEAVFPGVERSDCLGPEKNELFVETDRFYQLINNVIKTDYEQIYRYDNPLNNIEQSMDRKVAQVNQKETDRIKRAKVKAEFDKLSDFELAGDYKKFKDQNYKRRIKSRQHTGMVLGVDTYKVTYYPDPAHFSSSSLSVELKQDSTQTKNQLVLNWDNVAGLYFGEEVYDLELVLDQKGDEIFVGQSDKSKLYINDAGKVLIMLNNPEKPEEKGVIVSIDPVFKEGGHEYQMVKLQQKTSKNKNHIQD